LSAHQKASVFPASRKPVVFPDSILSRQELRELALFVVPQVLVEAAMRLGAYTGPETDKTAFRKLRPGVAPSIP